MSDSPTINEQWKAFMARVTAWLAMTFWNDNAMTQNDKENIEKYIAFGKDDDDQKENMMNRIKNIAQSYKNSDNPLPGGRRAATPLYGDAWEVISQKPQLAITLLTLKSGEKRTMEESTKSAINRIRQLVKINNFTTVEQITEHLTIGETSEEPTEGETLEG
tara:strand:- start:344 stop:829 length:486 start_codon:yes stop_codon:yes gene_type:complete